ncbi:MAG: TlpA disulfide reductase family protein [Thiohalocapsa sp.]
MAAVVETRDFPNRQRRWLLAYVAAALPMLHITAPLAAARRGLQPFDPRRTAPGLRLASTDGRQYDLNELAGRVVVVNFWSVWCTPCKAEMPTLQALQAGIRPQELIVLGVAVGDDPDQVSRFGRERAVAFPLLTDQERTVADRWSVAALPTTDVIDERGRIAFRVIGELDWRGRPTVQRLPSMMRE